MSLYRNTLKQGLINTWNRKYLWFFGLFAALLGAGGEYEILSYFLGENYFQKFIEKIYSLFQSGFFSTNTLTGLATLFKTNPGSLIVLFLFLLLFIASFGFLVWLMIISQTAIINEADKTKPKKIILKDKIKEGIIIGNKYFGSILNFNVIIKIFTALFFFVSLFVYGLIAENVFLKIIIFTIFIIASIIVSFIIKYSMCFCILKEESFVESMKKGLALFQKNWLISLEMSFILFFINFSVSIIAILLAKAISIPLMFLSIILLKALPFINPFFFILFILLLYFLFVTFVAIILTVFQINSWTILFKQLLANKKESKIVRIMQKK